MRLTLASASPIRRTMLDQAGIAFEICPADIDEEALKPANGCPDAIALALAEAKAIAVSSKRPGDWVIGSDSIVAVDGRMFAKPADRDQAAEHLRLFSGKAMTLVSAVALARDGRIDWSHADTATLHVRNLSDEFIASYLKSEWPAVGGCVGVFRMEGPGVQLFESVDGNYFTILGMPLIPLLGAFRDRDILAS